MRLIKLSLAEYFSFQKVKKVSVSKYLNLHPSIQRKNAHGYFCFKTLHHCPLLINTIWSSQSQTCHLNWNRSFALKAFVIKSFIEPLLFSSPSDTNVMLRTCTHSHTQSLKVPANLQFQPFLLSCLQPLFQLHFILYAILISINYPYWKHLFSLYMTNCCIIFHLEFILEDVWTIVLDTC